jgi:phage gpG-like protein
MQRALETRNKRYKDGAIRESYAKKRSAFLAAGGVQILKDTGHLLNSTNATVVGRTRIKYGSNLHYGIYHQTGSQKANLPRRMWAPVELVGKAWRLMRFGDGGKMWDTVMRRLQDHILKGNR